ncbi:hypothetical protein Hanom_Chr01g00043041 [Helianthus anomalus]
MMMMFHGGAGGVPLRSFRSPSFPRLHRPNRWRIEGWNFHRCSWRIEGRIVVVGGEWWRWREGVQRRRVRSYGDIVEFRSVGLLLLLKCRRNLQRGYIVHAAISSHGSFFLPFYFQ